MIGGCVISNSVMVGCHIEEVTVWSIAVCLLQFEIVTHYVDSYFVCLRWVHGWGYQVRQLRGEGWFVLGDELGEGCLGKGIGGEVDSCVVLVELS